jgi:MtN3 and saliva related transmembrane protein
MSFDAVEGLGFVAGLFGTFAVAPQAVKILRTRSARDLSLATYLLTLTGAALWFGYGFLAGSPAIMFWNAVSAALNGAIIALKIRHSGPGEEPGPGVL